MIGPSIRKEQKHYQEVYVTVHCSVTVKEKVKVEEGIQTQYTATAATQKIHTQKKSSAGQNIEKNDEEGMVIRPRSSSTPPALSISIFRCPVWSM